MVSNKNHIFAPKKSPIITTMKHKILLGIALITMASCTKNGPQPTDDKKLTLPVSELKMCRDWHVSFRETHFDKDDEIYPPQEYLLYDIDGDGRAEVLLRESQANFVALLCYDKEGKLTFVQSSFDGYEEYAVGKGWFVTQYDDHMGEFRKWTKWYYRVVDGRFGYIGYKIDGLEGVTDDGEFIEVSQDETGGKAPADSLVTFSYDLEGWQQISREALDSYMDHLDDWDDLPRTEMMTDGETAANPDF